jgi:hypothetical protein
MREVGVLGRDAERDAQHAARAGAGHVAVAVQRQRRQAAVDAHLVGRRAQVGGAVDQRAVQVEQHGTDAFEHQALRVATQ